METNNLVKDLDAYSRYLSSSIDVDITNTVSGGGLQFTMSTKTWAIYFDKDFSTKLLHVKFNVTGEPDRAFVALLEKAVELRDTYNNILKSLSIVLV